MASIQRFTSHKHTYFRIVESYRREDGHPTVRVLEHLGKAEDLLARLRAQGGRLRLRSVSSGAVDALFALGTEFDVAGEIDRAIKAASGRVRMRDGLTVGQSLLGAAIARACWPASKRAFAEWAAETTLPDRLGADAAALTSQHFWDQMDAVPLSAIGDIEHGIVSRVVASEKIVGGALAYDTTNFFTFIDTTNERCTLAERGHSKAGRHDLRQVGLGLFVSEDGQIPLVKALYRGSRSDVRTLKEELEPARRRLRKLLSQAQQLTFVFDQGAESKENLHAIVEGGDQFVTALKPSHHKKLLAEAAAKLEPITLSSGEVVRAHRTRCLVHGEARDVVIVRSDSLHEGQCRGLEQALKKALRTIGRISRHPRQGLAGAKAQAMRARNKQYLREILSVDVEERDGDVVVTPHVDLDARRRLEEGYFGFRVLATSNQSLATREIIEAYRGQSRVERAFRDLKDPWSCAFRPQFHWTDHKIAVHALIAFIALLLARVLLRRARALVNFTGNQRTLIQRLAKIRTARIATSTGKPGRPRLTRQVEECEPKVAELGLALHAIDPALYIRTEES
jgi:transposase